jgi:hypothetical protein
MSYELITKMVKSRRMRWAGHVAPMGDGRDVYTVLVGRPEGKDHLEDLGIDGRIILK